MIVAEAGVRALVALSPAGLPRISAISRRRHDARLRPGGDHADRCADRRDSGVAGIPRRLQTALQQGSRRSSTGHQRTRGALVVAEVALALVLLVSAGLLLRSIERLFATDAGFDASHVLTMQVQEIGSQFGSDDSRSPSSPERSTRSSGCPASRRPPSPVSCR